MTLVLQILLTFSILSLVAVGGANAVLPEMHRQLVELRGWMDDATFSQLYALAQAAPGPNILVASVMGWQVAGVSGMAAATLGMLVPAAVLAWGMAGLAWRLRGAPWLKPAQGGLVPVAIGLILAAGLTMAQASYSHGLWPLLVVAVSTIFVWRTDYNPLWVLAGGGVLGAVLLQ
ncbi:chromate transporter [Siccirubricoccus sp. KC 17139]|uniref:Chromate transporter n=1 Tax=Siccirubricoccus soli TaxID=2899147 RepID=A0ABT1CZB1_9PROT|nr:chromate transporter [Siccirubricoccus soli]MCO6414981.1 chromate transporter [Siccirubricoccus soli]MCP2681112.1 chromate transporter [Siccirubricoccus soli]